MSFSRSCRVRHVRHATRWNLPLRSLCDVQDTLHLLLLPSPHRSSPRFLRTLCLFCFTSASAFSLFACADVFFFCFGGFSFALTRFFVCGFSFFFDFFKDLLVSFLELRLLIPSVFFSSVPSVAFVVSIFVFFYFTAAIFLRSSDRKCCHDTSVVTAHVDHVVGLGIFVNFQVFSF